MSCNSCKFGVFIDNGYSNYTVMGSDFFCAKKLHPADGFDAGWGMVGDFKFGDTCKGKVEGDGVQVSVERDDDHTDEELEVLALHYAD